MELSIHAVTNRILCLLICISLLIAGGGALFLHMNDTIAIAPLPFAIGVAFALASNIAKVLLLKRAIVKVTDISAVNSAKIYFQVQYFLRMLLTGGALLAAALLPESMVSLFGAAIGVFAHPIAMYLVRLFVPTASMPDPLPNTPPNSEEGGE